MTSMAGNMMTRLNFPGKMLVEKENGEFLGVRMMMKKKKEGNRRMSLSGESSGYGIGGRSSEKVINGWWSNGRHVAAAEETTMMMNLGGNNKMGGGELGIEKTTSLHGRFVEEKFVYRQIFVIRSYEIGPDQTATMETIMNFLQVNFN